MQFHQSVKTTTKITQVIEVGARFSSGKHDQPPPKPRIKYDGRDLW